MVHGRLDERVGGDLAGEEETRRTDRLELGRDGGDVLSLAGVSQGDGDRVHGALPLAGTRTDATRATDDGRLPVHHLQDALLGARGDAGPAAEAAGEVDDGMLKLSLGRALAHRDRAAFDGAGHTGELQPALEREQGGQRERAGQGGQDDPAHGVRGASLTPDAPSARAERARTLPCERRAVRGLGLLLGRGCLVGGRTIAVGSTRTSGTCSPRHRMKVTPRPYPRRLPLDRDTLALALGLFGAFMNVVWPLFPRRTAMLAAQMGVSVSFAAHYGLTGASTGAVMNVLALAQAGLAIPLAGRPGFRIAYLLTLPVIAAVLWTTWSGAASACAAVGFALISVGRYQLRAVPFRALLLLAVIPWVGHNWIVGSVPGLVADSCAFVVGALMLRRALSSPRATTPADPATPAPTSRVRPSS